MEFSSKNAIDFTLKIASPEDDYFELLQEAIQESPYKSFGVTEEGLRNLMQVFSSDPSSRIVLLLCFEGRPVGLIAGSVQPNLLIPEWKVAAEAIWYVKPDYRSKYSLWLLDGFEFWAEKVGAKIINTANYGDKKIDRLYKKRGYSLVEHSFIKVLD